MRTRFILVSIVRLLFCSLSTLETPELVKLADDTSNDFSLMTRPQDISISTCNPALVARLKISRPRLALDRTPIQLGSISASRFTPDFLHFLCIQRT